MQVFTSFPHPSITFLFFPNQNPIVSGSGVTTLDIDLATQGEFFTDSNSNGVFNPGEAFEDWNRNRVRDASLKRTRHIFIGVPAFSTVEIDAIEALH